MAAGTWLSWQAPDGYNVSAPYFHENGEPIALVDRHAGQVLLRDGYATTESGIMPQLGSVRLGGSVWPVAGDSYLAAVREFQSTHAVCDDCCGPRRSHLVGLGLDRVEISPQGSDGYPPVALNDYSAALPDPVIAPSVRVRAHLNGEHNAELVLLGARFLGIETDDVAAASIHWIDSHGIDLTVIDDKGSRTLRLLFPRALHDADELGEVLHRLLTGKN